jgi:hypothetical protein
MKGLHQCQDGKKSWKEKRGIVTAPQEVLIGHRGQTVLATVKIHNTTPYGYKPGCSLQSLYNNQQAINCLKTVNLPIDFPVEGNQEFTMTIPLEISTDAKYSEECKEKEHVADFYLIKPNGTQFGEKIEVKFKVVERLDEGEFFQRAMDIFEGLDCKDDGLFDLTVECLKQAHNSTKKAKDLIDRKRFPEKYAQEEE